MTTLRTLTKLSAIAALTTTMACGGAEKGTVPVNNPVPHAEKTEPVPETKTEEPTKEVKPPEVTRTEPPIQNLVFPDEDFRKAQPKAGERRPFKLPRLKRVNLPRGMRGYLMEQHDLPTISVSMVIPGGSINDPKGKEGLASVCMGLLTDGTKQLDKIALSEALADTASSVSSYASRDEQGISMSTLSQHFDATFKLFYDSLMTPGFRKAEFDRSIKRRLARLRQARASARSVSRRVSRMVVMGQDHPQARVITAKSLRSLKVEDCVTYHATWIKPRGAKLFVVGDMTTKQLRAKFGKGLKAWKGRAKRGARIGKPTPMNGRVFFINIPGSAQSSVTILKRGPKRKARNFLHNSMAAAVLGGSFSARVNMNLREDKGYSYGARAGFTYTRKHGGFYAGAAVRSNSTYQSIIELWNDIQAMAKGTKRATKAELTRERNGAILGMPGRFSTGSRALRNYRNLIYYKLPLNYYNTYTNKLSRVTLAQVNRAAKRHFKLKNAKVLVVGDANAPLKVRVDGKDKPLLVDGKQVKLLQGLKMLLASGKLGKGKLVILDADGNVKK